MGVKNLWTLLSPTGRLISIETLGGRRLAVDSSIWMVQFLTVADKINKEDLVDDEDDEFMIGIGGYGDSGTGMGGGGTGNIGKKKNVVLIGFIRRICKLLFNEILPVFVFDGDAPEVKKREMERRRKLKSRNRNGGDGGGFENGDDGDLKRLAKRILIKKLNEEKKKKKKNSKVRKKFGGKASFAPGFRPSSSYVEDIDDSDDDDNNGHCESGLNTVEEEQKKQRERDNEEKTNRNGIQLLDIDNVNDGDVESNMRKGVIDECKAKDKDDIVNDHGFDVHHPPTINLTNSLDGNDSNSDSDEIEYTVPATDIAKMTYTEDVSHLRNMTCNDRSHAIEDIRRDCRTESRAESIGAASNPESYSQVQMMQFLKRSRIESAIQRVVVEANNVDKEGGGFQTTTAGNGIDYGRKLGRPRWQQLQGQQQERQRKKHNFQHVSFGSGIDNFLGRNMERQHRQKKQKHEKNEDVEYKQQNDDIREEGGFCFTENIDHSYNAFSRSKSTSNWWEGRNDDERNADCDDIARRKVKDVEINQEQDSDEDDDDDDGSNNDTQRFKTIIIDVPKGDIYNDNNELDEYDQNATKLVEGIKKRDEKKFEGGDENLFLKHDLSKKQDNYENEINSHKECNGIKKIIEEDREGKKKKKENGIYVSETIVIDACVKNEKEKNEEDNHDEESDENISWEDGESLGTNSSSSSNSTKIASHNHTVTTVITRKIEKEELEKEDEKKEEEEEIFLNKVSLLRQKIVDDNKNSNSKHDVKGRIGKYDYDRSDEIYEDEDDATLLALQRARKTASNLTDWAGRAVERAIGKHIKGGKKRCLDEESSDAGGKELIHNAKINISIETCNNRDEVKRDDNNIVSAVSAHANDDTNTKKDNAKLPLDLNKHCHTENYTNEIPRISELAPTASVCSSPPQPTSAKTRTILAVKVNPLIENATSSLHMDTALIPSLALPANDTQNSDTAIMMEEMKEDIMEVLRLFGVPYLVAPSEAEAQCVELEQLGLVDGILTEDSDALVFGANNVYKNCFQDQKYVEAYLCSDAEKLGIGKNEKVALAMLLGGDYTDGVKGVGIVNGMEILQAFPVKNDIRQGLLKFKRWLDGFNLNDEAESFPCNLTKEQIFCRKHKSARSRWSAPKGFPSPQVLHAYMNPVVDTSKEKFSWSSPDLVNIQSFCQQKMGWDNGKVNAIILPVIKKMESSSRQTRIESYFMRYEDDIKFAKIHSKRLKNVFGDAKEKV